MKKSLMLVCFAVMAMTAMMSGCGKQTVEQKVSANIKDGVHALSSEERQLAETNAKQFYNRSFPNGQDAAGELTTAKGMFLDCRPSDSNANGMVTCHGIMPKMKGGFDDKSTRYCGYRPELVGCSDEDTVPK